MSLNWREIELVLSELDLVGAQIQKVVQPSYDTLVLSCYKPGVATELLLCVAHGACRIHSTRMPVPKAEKPQRFMELLRSQVRGARIESIGQLGSERIVMIRVGRDAGERILYARLWSGAANVILCKPDGEIIDALARKPSKGELSGGRYAPEPSGAPPREFAVRDLPGGGSFNERADAFYAENGSELSRVALLERARRYFAQRRGQLDARLGALKKAAAEYAGAERYRELGDILMANQAAKPTGQSLVAEDFYRGGEVVIRVDASKGVVENARAYYDRSKKARSGAVETAAELDELRKSIESLESERERVEATENPYAIRAFLAKRKSAPSQAPKRFPGLSLERNGWLILIGRSAAENDVLLRRHVRGNDLWLHARDYSGSYVFVKARPGKSVPLEILLDAGSLALYYSKGRSSGAGDLYYTQAKYLRRAKDGPKGLVLPTQEKNLRIRLEEPRMRELRRLIGKDDG
ncbi:MAG: NFACT family protein [Spirochaetes bacterium]|nr:NFACT family protein [Spirochaetota bacterium]MBU1080739.1 NFACT family protein [Spirochaetota bacterium]